MDFYKHQSGGKLLALGNCMMATKLANSLFHVILIPILVVAMIKSVNFAKMKVTGRMQAGVLHVSSSSV